MTDARHSAARAPLKPVDAATVIIVKQDAGGPRILIGQRHPRHRFMPGKFVFPGGRVDPEDRRMAPAVEMAPATLDRLLLQMRGRASPARAQGIAMAAIRETYEETGLVIGRPAGSDYADGAWSESWRNFRAEGYAPDPSCLTYFARAITPPDRVRRFDSRFFVVAAQAIANLDRPAKISNEELLTPRWVTFGEAYGLDLPSITRDILQRLEVLWTPSGLPAAFPLPFRYLKGKTWRCDYL